MLDFVVAFAAAVMIILGHMFLPNMPATFTPAFQRAVLCDTFFQPHFVSSVPYNRPMADPLFTHNSNRELSARPELCCRESSCSHHFLIAGWRYRAHDSRIISASRLGAVARVSTPWNCCSPAITNHPLVSNCRRPCHPLEVGPMVELQLEHPQRIEGAASLRIGTAPACGFGRN